MDMENALSHLAEREQEIFVALNEIKETLDKNNAVFNILYENLYVNSYLIGNILRQKFNLSRPEINQLMMEAEESFKKNAAKFKKSKKARNLHREKQV